MPNQTDIGVLMEKVKLLLDTPFDRLMSNPKICDMYVEIFGVPLCRACDADRQFAFKELTKWLQEHE